MTLEIDRKNVTFCAQDGRRLPAQHFVSRPDTAWIGRGTAFSTPNAKRRCTLLAVWYVGQEEPWIILTDLPPEDAGPSWYALRFWIELGFKAVKSLGWKWDKTRRTDPARISRHWLVLSVATLLALAYGTRVEDAHDRRIAPGNLRTPPKTPDPRRRDPWGRPVRTVSVIRHGIDWLRRLLLRGRLWSRVWLLPEPWPEPKPNLEITRHAPPQKPVTYPCQGEPPDCSNIRAAGPPSPKADAHRPMVCGSRSSASAVAAAVQPWASSQTAYHRSRPRGVGARIIRRRKALASISHCSKSRCISLAPITNPSLTPGKANSAPSPIYPMFLRISPWLWFRKPHQVRSAGSLG